MIDFSLNRNFNSVNIPPIISSFTAFYCYVPSFSDAKSAANDAWYSFKDRIFPPTSLGVDLRVLATTPQLSAAFNQDAMDAIVSAFGVPESSQHMPFIAKIFQQLNGEQLNSVLKKVFSTYISHKDPFYISKKLIDLFTLHKIEMVIKSEFGRFTTTQSAASSVANKVKRGYEAQQQIAQGMLKRTAAYYGINIINSIVDTFVYFFDINELFGNNEDAYQGHSIAQRYYAFSYKWAAISSSIIALTAYVGSYVIASTIISGLVTVGCIGYFIYIKWLKPMPEKIQLFTNLVSEAIQGHLAPVNGRDKEIDEVIQALCSNTSSVRQHPLLLGQSGVGKTEIVNGLAQRIAMGNVPSFLKGKQLFSVNTSQLQGRVYLLEEIQRLIRGYESDAVFFFDEIHAAFSSRSNQALSQKFKTLLDPSLRGFRYCIGATTREEFNEYINNEDNPEKMDKAFIRRWRQLEVKSMNNKQTYTVLHDMVQREASDLTVEDNAIQIAADVLSHAAFAKKSQPFQSKMILAQAFVKARQPMLKGNIDELQQLKDKRSILESRYRNTYGSEVLPYTEKGEQENQELVVLQVQIQKLEEELALAQKKIDDFSLLVKLRNELKEITNLEALKIEAHPSTVSENDLKGFLLNFHYLQCALNEAIEEQRKKVEGASVIVDEKLINEIIAAEIAKVNDSKDIVVKEATPVR